MKLLKSYKKSISSILLVFSVLNYDYYALADSTSAAHLNHKTEQHNYAGKLSDAEWINLMQYAHRYVIQNKESIVPEKNESGFYRINLKAPDFLPENLGIEKLRLHYWPIDNSIIIKEESIHDHPKYFESLIINGGYKHSIYSMHTKPTVNGAKKFNLFRINKGENSSKSFEKLGTTFISKDKDESVKERKVVVMPTDVIHRVLFSVPGSLSINVVYKDKYNKNYYNVMLTENATEKDVSSSRIKVSGELKKKVINEIESRLFNALFQRG